MCEGVHCEGVHCEGVHCTKLHLIWPALTSFFGGLLGVTSCCCMLQQTQALTAADTREVRLTCRQRGGVQELVTILPEDTHNMREAGPGRR